MQWRLRTLMIVMSLFALFLATIGWGMRQQQRVDDLEAKVAGLERRATEARVEASAFMQHLQRPRTNIGVPWEVEKAMLMDGVVPEGQPLR